MPKNSMTNRDLRVRRRDGESGWTTSGFVEHLWKNAVDVKLAILPGVAHGYVYGLGLDVSLSPIGKWVYPPSGPAPEHGRMGSDAAMVCIKRIPGYDLPYRPFHEPTPYEYYDPDAPRTEGL